MIHVERLPDPSVDRHFIFYFFNFLPPFMFLLGFLRLNYPTFLLYKELHFFLSFPEADL